VQVLTETSVKSAWVAREFTWAADARSQGTGPCVILPVVVGDVEVPEPIADWAYLAMSASTDEQSLDIVCRAAMTSVATLPVDPNRPYQFAESELITYCAERALGDRRLIVDPAAVVPAMIRATISYGAKVPEEYRQQIVAQQRRLYNQFLRLLTVLDSLIPEFVRRVRLMASQHWLPEEWPQQLSGVIQSFARLVIGPIVLELTEGWRVAMEGELTQQAVINRFWAIGGSAGQRWLDLGFDGKPEIEGASLFLPADHFDEIGILSLTGTGAAPASEVTITDWLTIGLPQVVASKVPVQPSEVMEVAGHIGWSLTDYRRSGPR
jgi:hypothetical protein